MVLDLTDNLILHQEDIIEEEEIWENIVPEVFDDYPDIINPTQIYLNESSQYPLLNHKEEIELGIAIVKYDHLKKLKSESPTDQVLELCKGIVDHKPLIQQIEIFSKRRLDIGNLCDPNFSLLHGIYNNNLISQVCDNLVVGDTTARSNLSNLSLNLLCLPIIIRNIYAEYSVDDLSLSIIQNDTYDMLNTLTSFIKRNFKEIENSGKASHQTLVSSNLRLVISVAKKFYTKDLTILDRIQEGNIGLLKAANRYDPKRGFKFSTYATWWIRQSVSRGVADQARMIRLPVHLHEHVTRVKRAMAEVESSGENLPLSEISKKIFLSEERVQDIIRVSQHTSSLDDNVGQSSEDSTLTLQDLLIADDNSDPEIQTHNSILAEQVKNLLNDLSDREQKIIKMRFGIDQNYPSTLEAIGTVFGITRERVRQIEGLALRRLKRSQKLPNLKGMM